MQARASEACPAKMARCPLRVGAVEAAINRARLVRRPGERDSKCREDRDDDCGDDGAFEVHGEMSRDPHSIDALCAGRVDLDQ